MKRTKIGILSTIIVIIEALVIGVLSMIRTKYILLGFGTNVNGLVQLATQLSAYMLLFESGMTAAYQYNMYKPLLSSNREKISQLFSGMRHDFRIIALKMLLCVFFVAFGYSIILQNRGVTYFEAVSILAVMGIRIVSPYIFTIPLRTLLMVKEKKYMTDAVETIKNAITIIIELILIKNTHLPLYLILSVQIFMNLLSRFIYQYAVNKVYTNEFEIDYKAEQDCSPKGMTNDILIHRIAGLISSNADNVLLSFVKDFGLNSVTIYTSFSTLINYPVTLATRIVDSMRASIALKIHSDPDKSYISFREVFSFSKLCVLFVIPVYIAKGNDFITLWIGNEYTVNYTILILFAVIAMHQMLVPTIYAFRDANGLYKESKKFSIGQAVFNLVVSLILVKPLGIVGVLIGTVLSDWLFIEVCNLRLIFSKIFNRKLDIVLDYLMLFGTVIASSILCVIVDSYLIFSFSNWMNFVLESIIVSFLSFFVAFVSLFLYDYGFRKLFFRYFKFRRRK